MLKIHNSGIFKRITLGGTLRDYLSNFWIFTSIKFITIADQANFRFKIRVSLVSIAGILIRA